MFQALFKFSAVRGPLRIFAQILIITLGATSVQKLLLLRFVRQHVKLVLVVHIEARGLGEVRVRALRGDGPARQVVMSCRVLICVLVLQAVLQLAAQKLVSLDGTDVGNTFLDLRLVLYVAVKVAERVVAAHFLWQG